MNSTQTTPKPLTRIEKIELLEDERNSLELRLKWDDSDYYIEAYHDVCNQIAELRRTTPNG